MPRWPNKISGLDWLRQHINYAGKGCLTWPLSNDGRGYGQVGVKGRIRKAHAIDMIESAMMGLQDFVVHDRVAVALGDETICDRCGATFKTMNDTCTADLLEPCPGFLRIDEVQVPIDREVFRL